MLRILLPTDFSDNSFEAIRYALLTFKDIKCTYYLLHTYMVPIYQAEYVLGGIGQMGMGDIIRSTAFSDLEKLKTRLKSQYKNENHSFETFACMNTLTNQVNEMVAEKEIAVIVMGTKGATGAQEILFGTHTVHIIKKTKCPVIAIPPNFEYEAPKNILFPSDYEVSFKKEPLDLVLNIAALHKSRIEVLNVSYGHENSEEQRKNKIKLNELIGMMPHLFHDLPNQDVIEAINNFQQKHHINLLVMVRNKHTFIERLFIEPIINKIGFNIKVPFMVIPDFKQKK